MKLCLLIWKLHSPVPLLFSCTVKQYGLQLVRLPASRWNIGANSEDALRYFSAGCGASREATGAPRMHLQALDSSRGALNIRRNIETYPRRMLVVDEHYLCLAGEEVTSTAFHLFGSWPWCCFALLGSTHDYDAQLIDYVTITNFDFILSLAGA